MLNAAFTFRDATPEEIRNAFGMGRHVRFRHGQGQAQAAIRYDADGRPFVYHAARRAYLTASVVTEKTPGARPFVSLLRAEDQSQ